jgi:hypothetical protein
VADDAIERLDAVYADLTVALARIPIDAARAVPVIARL